MQAGSRGQTLNGKPFETAPSTATPRASSACACFRTRSSTKQAAKRWDAERYYTDPTYYKDKDARPTVPRGHVVRLLPRRARIRSSRPPIPNNPEWANLSSNVGAQYFWIDRIFYQAADYSRTSRSSCSTRRGPGSLDTSFVSTDNINNPRTMNAVY